MRGRGGEPRAEAHALQIHEGARVRFQDARADGQDRERHLLQEGSSEGPSAGEVDGEEDEREAQGEGAAQERSGVGEERTRAMPTRALAGAQVHEGATRRKARAST